MSREVVLTRTVAPVRSIGVCEPRSSHEALRVVLLQSWPITKLRMEHRRSMYCNNVIERDHGQLKHILKPKAGFKTPTTAYRTLQGMEAMHALRKNQSRLFAYGTTTQTPSSSPRPSHTYRSPHRPVTDRASHSAHAAIPPTFQQHRPRRPRTPRRARQRGRTLLQRSTQPPTSGTQKRSVSRPPGSRQPSRNGAPGA